MFFDYSYNQRSPSDRFMSLNVEESEVVRLRRLMCENILKVEKENLESVHKELASQKESAIKSSEKNSIQKKVTKPSNAQTSLSSKVKTATSKRLKSVLSKQTDNKKASTVQLPIVSSDHVCKNSHEDCQFSSIHFLNHFHSAFVSSKTQAGPQTYDAKEKYTPCAVPLAPPSQEKELSILDQKPVSNRNLSTVSNNVVHHLLYEPKKLTIQTLPSITIIGKKPSSNENIKIEKIKERDYFIGDCIKTTVLPALSKEVKDRISSTNLTQLNEISPSKIENTQVHTYHPKKSVLLKAVTTQDEKSSEIGPKRQDLKEMIKEALHELQVNHPKETTCEHSTQHDLPSVQKEQNGISPCNDCELDSFIGNANLFGHDATSVAPPPPVSPTTTVKSNCTQTNNESFHLHHALLDEKNVKRLIYEVISEYQQVSPPKHYSNKETNVTFDVEKAHCEVQTSPEKEIISQDITSNIHKEVQTSPISEKPIEILEILEMNRFSDSNNKEGNLKANPDSNENPNPLNPIHQEEASIIPEAVVSSELPSRLETVLNFIYNRFCKETGELSFNHERDPQSSNITSVQTREVSVQIHPAASSTKSTNTSEVLRIDAINQCEIMLLEGKNLEKDIKNASVQVTPIAQVILPTQEKVNSSVQCEQPVPILRNSCVQTMEFLATSENSANTSISSTPVSDSIFLDDMLSEGEIPWHLSLFSYADKAAAQSSNNTPGTSDKEKDYSLSEGEIPPKYLQHLNLIRSPSYDSGSDTCTDPPKYPLTLPPWMQRSEGEINPETHQPFSSSGCRCHCRTSSSSLSEGEIRVSNSHLSEGEVPSTFLRQRFEIPPTLHPQNFGAISSISPCESRHILENVDSSGMNSFQKENLAHSSVDLSEGELEKSQIPYQSTPCSSFLDAVAEEK